MQPILYLNKFRGFHDTFIPLTDVNFFVGENSTGKTSVLRLIKVLSESDFWLRPGFEFMEREFGYFSEITDEDNFEVGHTVYHQGKLSFFVKMKFTQRDNRLSLSEFSQIDNNYYIKGKIVRNRLKLKITESINLDSFKGSVLENFISWTNSDDKQLIGVKEDRMEILDYLPLVFAIQMALTKKIKNGKHEQGLPFYPLLRNLSWFSPIRTEPKRTYDSLETSYSPDGTHTPYIIKSVLDKKHNNVSRIKFEQVLNRFGKDSGLFENLSITKLGKTKSAPFQVNIFLDNRPLKITNVGYGVSQILPLIVEIIIEANAAFFAVQQPEVHLHPRGQAAFGDLIYKAASLEEKKFIIETHSDYTIDRFRLKLSKDETPDVYRPSSQVVFFTRDEQGNKVSLIPIASDGTYPDDQPSAFKDFFINEQLNLLGI